jgi:hypothetical protein
MTSASMTVKPLAWMAGSSVISWLVAAAVGGAAVNPELLFGMAGPLTSASATWIAIERTHASAPGRVMQVLIVGFALKMILFAAYVMLIIGVLGLRPVPFIVGFAAYFVILHLMEALFLRHLFATGARA